MGTIEEVAGLRLTEVGGERTERNRTGSWAA